MINELIEKIGGRERLEFLSEYRPNVVKGQVTFREVKLMARALLAVLGQGCLHHWISSEGRTDSGWLCSKCGDYDGPPAASASAVNFDLSKPGTEATVITNYHVPEGWKLVPLKAFPSQWAAGQKAFDAAGINKIDPVYHAMVEAAPAPGGDDA